MTTISIHSKSISFQELVTKFKRTAYPTTFALDDVTIDGSQVDMQFFRRALRACPTLERIAWRNVKPVDQNVSLDAILSEVFVAIPNLTHVKVDNCCVSGGGLCCVAYSESIQAVMVRGCCLRDRDALILAEACARLPNLEVIDVSHNQISEVGCDAAFQILKKNPSISYVKMDYSGTQLRNLSVRQGGSPNGGQARAA